VPGGELDGVPADAGEGVDDEGGGRGASGLRCGDGLRRGGVPALRVHPHAAVVQGEEAAPVGPVLARDGLHGGGGGISAAALLRLRAPRFLWCLGLVGRRGGLG
jgi:hypothetical protein